MNTHDGRFDVACYTGKVQVESAVVTTEPTILNPGDRVQLDRMKQELQTDTFDIERKNWVEGSIEFNATQLSDVFAEVERQFDVEIEVRSPEILQETYTGFIVQENLDSTLYAVCWPKGFKWNKVKPRRIEIEER